MKRHLNNRRILKMFGFIKDIFSKPKEEEQVMYLIVGLGNPGKEYDMTRHNIGFHTIDYVLSPIKTFFNNNGYEMA